MLPTCQFFKSVFTLTIWMWNAHFFTPPLIRGFKKHLNICQSDRLKKKKYIYIILVYIIFSLCLHYFSLFSYEHGGTSFHTFIGLLNLFSELPFHFLCSLLYSWFSYWFLKSTLYSMLRTFASFWYVKWNIASSSSLIHWLCIFYFFL